MHKPFIIFPSNPYHARAEELRHKYLSNILDFHKHDKAVKIGDIGIVIGSIPNWLFIWLEDIKETRFFKMSIPRFEDDIWEILYGRKIKVMECGTSSIDYHALLILDIEIKDEEKESNEEPIDSDTSRMDWESPNSK